MFTQAGFRPISKVIAFARVSRTGGRGVRWGWLVRWASSERAWASSTCIVWPEHVSIYSIIRLPSRFRWEHGPFPSSRLK